MSKINQKEYEVLKELDDEWKYLARNNMYGAKLEAHTSRPYKMTDSHWSNGDMTLELLGGEHLFQFIQWEDESPYNIQELIEEYLYDNRPKLFIDGQEQSFEFIEESEGTEVKTLESIREEIWEEMLHLEDKRKDRWADIKYQTLRGVLQKLGHLDEPEVLSQEFIDKYKVDYDNWMPAVPIVHLQNLLVPKQIKPKELYKAITGISPSIEEVCDSSGTETFLDESVSVERIIEEIMKVFESSGSEITEEPETVASVIVDFSRSVTRLKEVLNMEVEEPKE